MSYNIVNGAHLLNVMSLSSSPYIVVAPVPYPFTNPYAINGGLDCCKFYRKHYDAVNCLSSNATSISDPLACCTGGHIACPDLENGCKNHPLAHCNYWLS